MRSDFRRSGLNIQTKSVRNLIDLVRILDVFCSDFGQLELCPKTEQFCPIGPIIVQISEARNLPKSEQNCSDFGCCLNTKLSENGPKVNLLKSKRVRSSDVHGMYVQWMSEYRTSGIRIFGKSSG